MKILSLFIILLCMKQILNDQKLYGQSQKSALLVVDMQKDFIGSSARMPVDSAQAEQMLHITNQLIDSNRDWEIVYIYNSYSKYDLTNIFRIFAAIKNTEGEKMDERLKIKSTNIFSKSKMSAFTNPELNKFLQEKNISTLYIVGLYSENCITGTAKSALKQKYQVNIIQDALASKTDTARSKACERLKKLNCQILKGVDLLK